MIYCITTKNIMEVSYYIRIHQRIAPNLTTGCYLVGKTIESEISNFIR